MNLELISVFDFQTCARLLAKEPLNCEKVSFLLFIAIIFCYEYAVNVAVMFVNVNVCSAVFVTVSCIYYCILYNSFPDN